MDSRRARAGVSLTDNTFLSTSERTLPRLQHQFKYPSLLAALHKVYSSSSPNPSEGDPLDVCPGARELLDEHFNEEGIVQPSPGDALDYLLDTAIDRFGYSARDVFSAVFQYPMVNLHHERAFGITYANLLEAVSAVSKEQMPDHSLSNQILAISPVDLGPLKGVRWSVDFKSGWVAKNVIRQLREATLDETHRQIRVLRGIPAAGPLVGWMLEPLAHHYITSAKNDFLLFNMNSNGADPPRFTLVRDPPVPNNEGFTKVERKIVRLQSIEIGRAHV